MAWPATVDEQEVSKSSQRGSFHLLERMACMASAAITDKVGGLCRPFRQATGRQLRPVTQSLKGATAAEHRQQLNTRSQRRDKHHFRMLQTSLKPKGPGCNDRTATERAINILTSLPFLAVGLHTQRARCSRESKRYGSSLVLVGAAATAYHATSGRLRRHLRKLDYWTISLASTRLLEALATAQCRRQTARCRRRMLQAGSWALTPFRPTAVSTLNFGLAEVEYARSAMADPALRRVYRWHAFIGGVGLGCFMLEDLAISRGFHYVHALWHVHACYAVATVNALLRAREQDAVWLQHCTAEPAEPQT